MNKAQQGDNTNNWWSVVKPWIPIVGTIDSWKSYANAPKEERRITGPILDTVADAALLAGGTGSVLKAVKASKVLKPAASGTARWISVPGERFPRFVNDFEYIPEFMFKGGRRKAFKKALDEDITEAALGAYAGGSAKPVAVAFDKYNRE